MKEDLSVQPSNSKLERFKEIVLGDAEQLKNKILDEVSLQKNKALKEAEVDISDEVKLFIEKETESIKNKYKQALSKENFDGRKSLLVKRDEVINLVFSEAKQKLVKFCKTEDYKKLLIEKTKQAKENLGDKDIEIFLKQDDMVFESDIKLAWGNALKCSVLVSNSIELGGIMFSSPQTNLIIDETFDSKILQMQREFIKLSGLYFG